MGLERLQGGLKPDSARSLNFVYDGWDGYHRSIVSAIAPLTLSNLRLGALPTCDQSVNLYCTSPMDGLIGLAGLELRDATSSLPKSNTGPLSLPGIPAN